MKQDNKYIEELLKQRSDLVDDIKHIVFMEKYEWQKRVDKLETQVSAIDEILKILLSQ